MDITDRGDRLDTFFPQCAGRKQFYCDTDCLAKNIVNAIYPTNVVNIALATAYLVKKN